LIFEKGRFEVIRVYEFAKKHGLTSKAVIDFLKERGVVVTGHMVSLSDDQLTLLSSLTQTTIINPKKDTVQPMALEQQEVSQKTIKDKKNISDLSIPSQVEAQEKVQEKTVERVSPIAQQQTVKKEVVEVAIHIPAQPHSVDEIAQFLGKTSSEVIVLLLSWGVVPAKNQKLALDVVTRLARHYQAVLVPVVSQKSIKKHMGEAHDSPSLTEPRVPVIVIIGHVDHGKTTLLDFIRSTRVALKEKGGITQHVSAYEVKTNHGNVVFIDTPGHEAFVKIRQRGLRIADIAILVVAADDGVMPQTVEAIRQAREAKMVVVVAINKMDKVDPARVDIIKSQLAQHNLVTEDWGGDVMCIPISAKTGSGIDNLLELVALQAQLMELKTSLTVPASGYILEAKIEKGRGPVGVLLLNQGIVRVGDCFIAGSVGGKVTSIVDQTGKPLSVVGPSVPVQISGFDNLADAGDQFIFATKSDLVRMDQGMHKNESSSVVGYGAGGIKVFVKTDNDSTKEAVVDAIAVVNKASKKQFDILRAAVGPVTEGDIQTAYSAQADIVVLHSRIDPKAALLAQNKKITIHYFDIIYKMTEFLQQWAASESLQAVTVRKKIGSAEVLRVFDIKNIGVVAGCIVRDGRFVRDALIVILRYGKKVGEGKIKSLQREKRVVKEVHSGFECGFVVDGFSDWIVGDQADCYVTSVEMK
jgi:translation initiation factor IF-2